MPKNASKRSNAFLDPAVFSNSLSEVDSILPVFNDQIPKMIIFSSPKPFNKDTTSVQLSAIRSWALACPGVKIFLFGDQQAVRPICEREGWLYAGSLPVTERGGEILSTMFRGMSRQYPDEMLLYLNSDILLQHSFSRSLVGLEKVPGPWLASCRRWCLPAWEGGAKQGTELLKFLGSVENHGHYGPASALDLFLFRGLNLDSMPPFRIGHAGWDNWMIYHARMLGIPIIDLSPAILALHCRHDYSYARGNTSPKFRDGILEEENARILERDNRRFHLGHATHDWLGGRCVARRGRAFRHRQFEVWVEKNPANQVWVRPLRRILHPWIKRLEKSTEREENWFGKSPPYV